MRIHPLLQGRTFTRIEEQPQSPAEAQAQLEDATRQINRLNVLLWRNLPTNNEQEGGVR